VGIVEVLKSQCDPIRWLRGGYVAVDKRVWEVKLRENLCGAKGNLREVVKDKIDLDHWIQKDMWRRSMYSGRIELERKTRALKPSFPKPELSK
jgi:hypothetical protein